MFQRQGTFAAFSHLPSCFHAGRGPESLVWLKSMVVKELMLSFMPHSGGIGPVPVVPSGIISKVAQAAEKRQPGCFEPALLIALQPADTDHMTGTG